MGLRNKNNVLECHECGWRVTCGDFYKSFTGKSMLPGSALHLFETYLERFPRAKNPKEKMLLIDWLIHQFHVMQGVARMPVGKNVIQGTADQVRDLIESLAYGTGSTQNLCSVDEWRSVYYDPVRMFKQLNSHSRVQEIASRLGISDRNQMSEDVLIPEILRLAPDLAVNPGDGKKR
jgi:hypothetical protein